MKKTILVILFTFLFLISAVFAFRFIIGGSEDTWICENGQWVAHGVPSAPKPSSGCVSKQLQEVAIESSNSGQLDLCFQGEYPNGSCVSKIDINNDGREELVYEPKGASWHMVTTVLKESTSGDGFFESFCENCSFKTYARSPIFKDIEGDGDTDVIVPTVADDDWNFKFEVYHWQGKDFKLKDVFYLSQDPQKQAAEVEKLLQNY